LITACSGGYLKNRAGQVKQKNPFCEKKFTTVFEKDQKIPAKTGVFGRIPPDFPRFVLNRKQSTFRAPAGQTGGIESGGMRLQCGGCQFPGVQA
jgi:hypothetical protein